MTAETGTYRWMAPEVDFAKLPIIKRCSMPEYSLLIWSAVGIAVRVLYQIKYYKNKSS